MENLINAANDKSSTNQRNLIEEITSLCVLTIIFSDFEVELLFDIPNFSPNYQKIILIETISFCSDRQNVQNPYIELKYQFWVLKVANTTLTDSSSNSLTISKGEIDNCLNTLNKEINQEKYNCSDERMKLLVIKIAYELGMYYYYTTDSKMEPCFDFLIYNIDHGSNNFKSKMYFDIEKVRLLRNYLNKHKNRMEIEENEQINNTSSSSNFVFNIQENPSLNDFQECQSTLEFCKVDEPNTITNSMIIEYSSSTESLAKCENLIYLTSKNEKLLKKTIEFTNKFKEQFPPFNSSSDASLLNIAKELSFLEFLLKLIEMIFSNKDKLEKKYLNNLSETIINKTLTDNLALSGKIHSMIINFKNDFKKIYRYFNDFVDFFSKSSTGNKIEKVNQIGFLCRVLSVFNLVLNQTKNSEVEIESEFHQNLINIFAFWLGKEIDSKNIIKQIIKSIKVTDYLRLLKIVYFEVLKFVIEKKHYAIMDNTNQIYDIIYDMNPKVFKIDSLIEDDIAYIKEKYNITGIKFTEMNKGKYDFDPTLFGIYIKNLLNAILEIEEKIVKYDNLAEIDILKRRISIEFVFLSECSKTKESILKDSEGIVADFSKYEMIKFQDFKNNYFNIDMISDLSQAKGEYQKFKKMINQESLLRGVYILSQNGKYFEAAILCQYLKKINYDLVYTLLKLSVESTINFDLFQFIWKAVYFESLSNSVKQNEEALTKIKLMIKRVSNHQFFKKHPLRQHFKIINFFKLVDYLNNA